MIILAAAIILSLSNSGIIGKANKAKTDTDISNAKDLVAMAHADWMLDEAKIKENDSTITSFSNYAEKKLEEAGYKVGVGAYTVTEDGGVYEGLNKVARETIKSGIEIGAIIKGYNELLATKPDDDKKYPIETGVVSNTEQQDLEIITSYTWKYIGVGKDGSLQMAPDMTGTTNQITIGGANGYLNGPRVLNEICKKLYSVESKGTARSMNIDDVLTLLEYNGPKGTYFTSAGRVETAEPFTVEVLEKELGQLKNRVTPDGKDNFISYESNYYYINKTEHVNRITTDETRKGIIYQPKSYWLASTCVQAGFHVGWSGYRLRSAGGSVVSADDLFLSNERPYYWGRAVRPVVSLDSNVQLTPNENKTEWTIS